MSKGALVLLCSAEGTSDRPCEHLAYSAQPATKGFGTSTPQTQRFTALYISRDRKLRCLQTDRSKKTRTKLMQDDKRFSHSNYCCYSGFTCFFSLSNPFPMPLLHFIFAKIQDYALASFFCHKDSLFTCDSIVEQVRVLNVFVIWNT